MDLMQKQQMFGAATGDPNAPTPDGSEPGANEAEAKQPGEPGGEPQQQLPDIASPPDAE
jgi:hypothetical protein